MSAVHTELINWSGSHRYRARAVHRPESRDELRTLVTEARGTLQVLGSRHSFTDIGDADELIVLDGLPDAETIEIDSGAMTVTVGPAVTYATLADALNRDGVALANLASLPHISVAGAVGTATHGSGPELTNLATAVVGLELLTGDGDTIRLERGDPRLPGAAVHLGALGVVTGVTLELLPYYELRQDVYVGLEWDALAEHFDEIMGAGRSVSVFHDFGDRVREVWVKGDPARDARPELFGAPAAHEPRNPVPGGPPENATPQLGVPGPWSERLPHFRSGFTPSFGQEIQSEWFVAHEHGVAAVQALRPLVARIAPLLRTAELRTIAADELWMSPQYGRSSAGLHFTWRLEPDAVAEVCGAIEAALAPFAPRPHWAKLYTMAAPPPERLEDFRRLCAELDPRGVFANAWLRGQVLAGR